MCSFVCFAGVKYCSSQMRKDATEVSHFVYKADI